MERIKKEKTIELRKKYKTKLPDAIVAASAIVKGLPLITADKGFNLFFNFIICFFINFIDAWSKTLSHMVIQTTARWDIMTFS